jgi:hypothetical protein
MCIHKPLEDWLIECKLEVEDLMEVEVDGIVCNCSSAFELTLADLPNSLSFLVSIGGSLFLCTKNSDFFFDSSDLSPMDFISS